MQNCKVGQKIVVRIGFGISEKFTVYGDLKKMDGGFKARRA
jgi:hypothetical protein